MQINTTRFGALTVDESRVLTFPEGLPGFEGCRHFTLVPHPAPSGEECAFEWIQSVEDCALAFLAIDPHCVFSTYEPQLAYGEMRTLALEHSDGARWYCLLTVPKDDPCGITANLLAPVVVNPEARLAKQVILSSDEYGLRHRLLPN